MPFMPAPSHRAYGMSRVFGEDKIWADPRVQIGFEEWEEDIQALGMLREEEHVSLIGLVCLELSWHARERDEARKIGWNWIEGIFCPRMRNLHYML